MKNKILCVGEALIDMICTDKGSLLIDGQNFLKKAGGAPTNVAAAIAALGGRVSLAAKVGKDPFGQQLIQTMRDFGVETDFMFEDVKQFTTMAFVSLLNDGERDFVFNRGADGELSIEDVSKINISEFSNLHFGSATAFLHGPLQIAYRSLLQQALHEHIFVSFDPNYRQLLFKNNLEIFVEQSWFFLERCNFFKVSEEEAILLTGAEDTDKAVKILRQKTSCHFAVTLGKAGTLFCYRDQKVIVPSIPVSSVDSTGAGDAFVGAVLYQLSSLTPTEILNLSFERWQQIMVNGNKAGARTCEYMGAMEAFKHLNSSIFS